MKNLALAVFVFYSSLVQSDVMNLNEFFPTRIEDSSPIDVGRWQLQGSAAFEQQTPGQMILRPSLRHGLGQSTQLEAFHTVLSGGKEMGSGVVGIGGMHMLNKPKGAVPAVAINVVFNLPTAKHQRGLGTEGKLMASWLLQGSEDKPVTQFHVNVRDLYQDKVASDERRSRWLYALGMSRRLREKTALILDLVREEEGSKKVESNFFEAGVNHELVTGTTTAVGVFTSLGDESPSWGLTLSYQKDF